MKEHSAISGRSIVPDTLYICNVNQLTRQKAEIVMKKESICTCLYFSGRSSRRAFLWVSMMVVLPKNSEISDGM